MKPTLDSRQLHAFAALAHRGTFTLAAKDLFITQSAVSHAIKALESDLGTRLVDRLGRRVVLTKSGERFLQRTENILREMETARLELDSVSKWGHERLRIGASVTGCEHILPEVLREFRQSYPKCVVRIEPGDHAHQLALLRTGQIDLAVMLEPAPAALAEITVATLFSDELRFLVAPDHPWAKLGRAPREKIETESLIFFSKTSQTFRLVAEYFIEQKIALSDSIEVKSMDAMKELAKVGHGVAVMATWLAREELDSGALISVPLGSRKLRRRWVVACRKGRRLALAEETFIGLCEALAESRGLTASE